MLDPTDTDSLLSSGRPRRARRLRWALIAPLAIGSASAAVSGCQDGPMYALKAANPYFVMKEWKQDEDIGVTDHVRRAQLSDLAESIAEMPAGRQVFWASQLKNILENDPSPEMRRLAIVAAGSLADPVASADLIQLGVDDSVTKVRMEACRALGKQSGDDAARMLAAVVGTDTDLDVRQAAIAALGRHRSQISTELLRRTLEDRDPATRSLAIASLRQVTGQNHGEDPSAWIAALDQNPGLREPGAPAAEKKSAIATLPKFLQR